MPLPSKPVSRRPRKSRRPVTAQFQHKRGTMYVCERCKAPASFGYDVNRFAHGRWYCAAHRPGVRA